MKRLFKVTFTGVILLAGFSGFAEKILTVGAAASLKNVMTDLKSEFEKNNPGIRIKATFAATGAIMAQIRSGAPVEVFMSANSSFGSKSNYSKVLVKNSIKVMCTNALVFAVKKSSKLSGKLSLKELLFSQGMKRVGIGNPSYVPAGKYAKKLLISKGLWNDIKKKAVQGSNVRQVLSWVEIGAVNGGFVYSTDAAMSPKLKVLKKYDTIAGKKLIYPVAVTKYGKTNQAGYKFINFLVSDKAKTIFKKYGFLTGRNK